MVWLCNLLLATPSCRRYGLDAENSPVKTDDLVAMLATGAIPVAPAATAQRYALALGWGAFGATLLMAIFLGVRRDLAAAVYLPFFWVKLAFPTWLAAGALFAATRLSRPGVRLGRLPAALLAPILAIWLLAAFDLMNAAPSERSVLIMGNTWVVCPFLVALLSLPLFVAAMWAMKGLAPTRLGLAGGAAGLLAGAMATMVYALHCPEMAAPFLAIWYVLGMLIPTVAGLLLGPWLLRW